MVHEFLSLTNKPPGYQEEEVEGTSGRDEFLYVPLVVLVFLAVSVS